MLVVGSDVHYFDDVDRLWKKNTKDVLPEIVRKCLHRIFGNYNFYQKDGNIKSRLHYVPNIMKDHGWLTGVRMEVQSKLVAPKAPEYGKLRHLLAFEDGMVYNFNTKTISEGEAWMYISTALPFRYSNESAINTYEYEIFTRDVTEHLRQHASRQLVVLDSFDGHLFGSPDLFQRFHRFIKIEPVLQVLFSIGNHELNDHLYMLLHFARPMFSSARL